MHSAEKLSFSTCSQITLISSTGPKNNQRGHPFYWEKGFPRRKMQKNLFRDGFSVTRIVSKKQSGLLRTQSALFLLKINRGTLWFDNLGKTSQFQKTQKRPS